MEKLVGSWDEFGQFIRNEGGDARFVHAEELFVNHSLGVGIHREVNIFGPGYQLLVDRPYSITRKIESYILNRSVVLPNSLTVLNSSLEYMRVFSENIYDPLAIPGYDWHLQVDNGRLVPSASFFERVVDDDDTAMLICGPGFHNYGHFLYDGLPAILMYKKYLDEDSKIVGKPLFAWQLELLKILGLDKSYKALERPVRFKKLLATTMLSMHVSYPTRFVRVLFDSIRFKIGSGYAGKGLEKIFVSRGESKKRHLLNRAEVESLFFRLGFEIVKPQTMSVRDQCLKFSTARVVVGEAGAGMGNIGFCDPGALILEILPFNDQWTRGASFVFGHQWHGYFPIVNEDGSYSVDCQELERVIKKLV